MWNSDYKPKANITSSIQSANNFMDSGNNRNLEGKIGKKSKSKVNFNNLLEFWDGTKLNVKDTNTDANADNAK